VSHLICYVAAITMLYHKGLPVTSKEAETLRTAYGQIAYKKHVTRKENWKPSTYATIWWEVHSRALAKLEDNDRTRIKKLINGILPTNVKLHQQDKQHSPKCPSCNNAESNSHISSCNNPRRKKLRNQMFSTLRKSMEKQETHIHVQKIIMQGLTAAIKQKKGTVEEADLSFQPSGIIKQALKEQNEIGWINFYKGRMSIKWEQVQRNHYNKQKKKQSDPHIWATTIITSMWQGFLQMWEDRNNDQHGRDQNKADVKERDTLLRKLKHLYVQKDILDPKDQRLYHKPVQAWEEATKKN
jgi:hypothetical protein